MCRCKARSMRRRPVCPSETAHMPSSQPRPPEAQADRCICCCPFRRDRRTDRHVSTNRIHLICSSRSLLLIGYLGIPLSLYVGRFEQPVFVLFASDWAISARLSAKNRRFAEKPELFLMYFRSDKTKRRAAFLQCAFLYSFFFVYGFLISDRRLATHPFVPFGRRLPAISKTLPTVKPFAMFSMPLLMFICSASDAISSISLTN